MLSCIFQQQNLRRVFPVWVLTSNNVSSTLLKSHGRRSTTSPWLTGRRHRSWVTRMSAALSHNWPRMRMTRLRLDVSNPKIIATNSPFLCIHLKSILKYFHMFSSNQDGTTVYSLESYYGGNLYSLTEGGGDCWVSGGIITRVSSHICSYNTNGPLNLDIGNGHIFRSSM